MLVYYRLRTFDWRLWVKLIQLLCLDIVMLSNLLHFPSWHRNLVRINPGWNVNYKAEYILWREYVKCVYIIWLNYLPIKKKSAIQVTNIIFWRISLLNINHCNSCSPKRWAKVLIFYGRILLVFTTCISLKHLGAPESGGLGVGVEKGREAGLGFMGGGRESR